MLKWEHQVKVDKSALLISFCLSLGTVWDQFGETVSTHTHTHTHCSPPHSPRSLHLEHLHHLRAFGVMATVSRTTTEKVDDDDDGGDYVDDETAGIFF